LAKLSAQYEEEHAINVAHEEVMKVNQNYSRQSQM
jgi:hypothetical protein